MNYLPIIAIALFILLKSSDDYKSLLSDIPIGELSSLLSLLGLNQETVTAISNLLPAIISGNFDRQTLIRNLLPFAVNLFKANSQKSEYQAEYCDLSDIKGIANDAIIDSLNAYFA